MIGLWNVNWLNQNSQRSYPLADFGDKCCVHSPEIRVPDDFLLALRLSIHTGHDVRVENFFLKSLAVAGGSCTVVFGYNDGSAAADCPEVASVHVTQSDSVVNCRLNGLGSFEDTVGYAAFNGQSSVFSDLAGYFLFSAASTPLEPDCIVPMLRGVASFAVDSGSGAQTRYYGDIQLVAGANMSISTSTSGQVTTITLNAVNSSGFETDCSCDIHEEAPCVRSIGGVYPDSDGNIRFEGLNCVSVVGSGNTLTFQDTCAEPDCGCSELTSLASTIREMEDGITTLNTFIENLYAVVLQTNAAITSSTKCDGGCAGSVPSGTLLSQLRQINY